MSKKAKRGIFLVRTHKQHHDTVAGKELEAAKEFGTDDPCWRSIGWSILFLMSAVVAGVTKGKWHVSWYKENVDGEIRSRTL